MDRAKCKGCGADILWIVKEGGGRHPLDVKPIMMYVPCVDALGEEVWRLKKCYRSHFSTCPNAKEFRSSNEKRTESAQKAKQGHLEI